MTTTEPPAMFIQKQHAADRLAALTPQLRRIVKLINTTGLRSDADDLFQAVAEKTLRLLETHPDHGDTFFCTCARRLTLDTAKLDGVRRQYAHATVVPMPLVIDDDGEAIEFDAADPSQSVEEQVISSETLTTFRAQLTPKQQAVLDLLMAGYRQYEIADMLHVEPASTSYMLARIQTAWRLFDSNL